MGGGVIPTWDGAGPWGRGYGAGDCAQLRTNSTTILFLGTFAWLLPEMTREDFLEFVRSGTFGYMPFCVFFEFTNYVHLW
jgi:hypothetical protein